MALEGNDVSDKCAYVCSLYVRACVRWSVSTSRRRRPTKINTDRTRLPSAAASWHSTRSWSTDRHAARSVRRRQASPTRRLPCSPAPSPPDVWLAWLADSSTSWARLHADARPPEKDIVVWARTTTTSLTRLTSVTTDRQARPIDGSAACWPSRRGWLALQLAQIAAC